MRRLWVAIGVGVVLAAIWPQAQGVVRFIRVTTSERGEYDINLESAGMVLTSNGQGVAPSFQPAVGGGGTGTAAQTSFLVSGGEVVWTSNYNFTVSAAAYYIQGVRYESAQTDISLTAAHATLDRIDVIAVSDAGAVVTIDGTAAAQPSEPDYDPGTQLKLGIVFVESNTTAPNTSSSSTIYAENTGGPGEWACTTSGTGFNCNSTTNPHAGSKDIEGTTVAAGAYAQLQISSGTFDPATKQLLVFYLRSKATWSNNRGLQLSLRTAGVLQGQAVVLNRSGSYGFDSSVTSTYQQIAIPLSAFAVPAGQTVTQLRVTDFGGSIGFYLDDVTVQGSGVSQPSPTGLTSVSCALPSDGSLTGSFADQCTLTLDGGTWLLSASLATLNAGVTGSAACKIYNKTDAAGFKAAHLSLAGGGFAGMLPVTAVASIPSPKVVGFACYQASGSFNTYATLESISGATHLTAVKLQ